MSSNKSGSCLTLFIRKKYSYLSILDTASVEHYMERQRRVQERGKEFVTQMQTTADNFQANTDKLTATLTGEIHKEFIRSMKR